MSFLAPSVGPGELTIAYKPPTTTTLSWRPVPEEMLNGVITGVGPPATISSVSPQQGEMIKDFLIGRNGKPKGSIGVCGMF